MNIFNKNSAAVALAAALVLGFAGPVAALAAGPGAVNLGSASSFVILAKTGISTTGSTSITGNIGVSPVAASYITGFGLTMDVSNTFSTSALVSGKVYAADYTPPTPTVMTTAVSDMQTAYTDAMGRTNPTATELGAGNIGGLTIAPGLYKWGTDVLIPTDVTLSGGPNDVWIFQVAGNLSMSSAAHIVLSGGAQASNVFWVIAGQTTIGTTAVFNGTILDQTTIVFNTGAVLNGRALAQAAVTLDANAVTSPTGIVAVITPTPVVVTNPVVVVTSPSTNNSVVCATDVQQCSDGSYVMRQGSSCTFAACPIMYSSQTVTPSVSVNTNSDANTNAALQTQLNGLLATLNSLQARAAGQQATIKTLATNLGTGSMGSDVTVLQQFLISQNKGSAAQALANVGATGYFGPLTHAALVEFQTNTGISPALGNFGAITRTYLATHY
jgi:hypothetical protein